MASECQISDVTSDMEHMKVSHETTTDATECNFEGSIAAEVVNTYLHLPMEVRVRILCKTDFVGKMGLLWADRSLYHYCCHHEVISARSVVVKSNGDMSLVYSFYSETKALDNIDCIDKSQFDFVEVHSRKSELYDRSPFRRIFFGVDFVPTVWVRQMPVEGIKETSSVEYKSDEIVFDGSCPSSLFAFYKIDVLSIEDTRIEPLVTPRSFSCTELVLAKKTSDQQSYDSMIKWIDIVRPKTRLSVKFGHDAAVKIEELVSIMLLDLGGIELSITVLDDVSCPFSRTDIDELLNSIPFAREKLEVKFARSRSVPPRLCHSAAVDATVAESSCMRICDVGWIVRRVQHWIDRRGENESALFNIAVSGLGMRFGGHEAFFTKVLRLLLIPAESFWIEMEPDDSLLFTHKQSRLCINLVYNEVELHLFTKTM